MSSLSSSRRFRPIPTSYAGREFRSRTEARWAVWLDQLQIPWEYEHEGYELPGGNWYLPDFYVPRWSCFLEVKGAAEPDERTRCAVLSDVIGKTVLLLEGEPREGVYNVTRYERGYYPCHLMQCQFAVDRRDPGRMRIANEECWCCLDADLEHDRPPLPDHKCLREACRTASQAFQYKPTQRGWLSING